jgi:hypothetical protein
LFQSQNLIKRDLALFRLFIGFDIANLICAEPSALQFAMTTTPDLKSSSSIIASMACRNPIYAIHRVLSALSPFSLNGSELGPSQFLIGPEKNGCRRRDFYCFVRDAFRLFISMTPLSIARLVWSEQFLDQ